MARMIPPTIGDDAPPGEHAVFAVRDGRARLVPVRLGGRNGSEAWITDGITAGEAVILYPSAAVRDGVRVSARRV